MLEARLVLSYVFDWVIIIALICVTILVFPERVSIQHHQLFSLNNFTLQYPHKDDTISYGWLAIICVAIPVGIFFVWCLIIEGWTSIISGKRRGNEVAQTTDNAEKGIKKDKSSSKLFYFERSIQSRLQNLHLTLLGFFMSLTAVIFVTYLFKVTVGKPRPDVIARCRPSYEAIIQQYRQGANATSKSASIGGGAGAPNYTLVDIGVCRGWGISGGSAIEINGSETTDVRFTGAKDVPVPKFDPIRTVTFEKSTGHWEELLEEGWRSFPSLHSGVAFVTLTYLALFLACKSGVLARIDTPKPWAKEIKKNGDKKQAKPIRPRGEQREGGGPAQNGHGSNSFHRRDDSSVQNWTIGSRPQTLGENVEALTSARSLFASGTSVPGRPQTSPATPHRLHPSYARRAGSDTQQIQFNRSTIQPQSQTQQGGQHQNEVEPEGNSTTNPFNPPKTEFLSLNISTRGVSPLFIISFAPIVVALFIVTTRISDYRSHPFDVLFGSMLGIVFAVWGFRQYYPAFDATDQTILESGGYKVDWKPGQAFAYRRWGARQYMDIKSKRARDDEEDHNGIEMHDIPESGNVIDQRSYAAPDVQEPPYQLRQYPGEAQQPSQNLRGPEQNAQEAENLEVFIQPPTPEIRPATHSGVPAGRKAGLRPNNTPSIKGASTSQHADDRQGRSPQRHRRGLSLNFRRSLSRRRSLRNLEGKRRKSMSDMNTSIVPTKIPRIPTALLDGITGDGALGVRGSRL